MRSPALCGILLPAVDDVRTIGVWPVQVVLPIPRQHAPHILRVAHGLMLICCLIPLIPAPRPTGLFGTHPPQEEVAMSTRIYVGNLPYSATDEQVSQLFAAFGEVREVSIVVDRATGHSKGIAFVQMESDEAAREAISGVKRHRDRRPHAPRERGVGPNGAHHKSLQ